MGQFSLTNLFGVTIRESANDGSDFTNPDADYRRLFLGEDGQLHVKDSSGTVTDIGSAGGSVQTAHGCRAARASTNFSVGSNTLTAVQFDAEDFDTDTMHDNASNNTRITIPSISGVTTGLWSIKASGYSDVTSGRTDVLLKAGGATPIGFAGFAGATAITAYSIAVDYVLSATNYIECLVRTTAGSGNVVYDAGVSPIFEVAFLGKVS